MALGCSETGTSPPEGGAVESTSAALVGANLTDAADSRATTLLTDKGIAGTVGSIGQRTAAHLDPEPTCTGTLVARDVVLTSRRCVPTSRPVHPWEFEVAFRPDFESENWDGGAYPVESVTLFSPMAEDVSEYGFAALHLGMEVAPGLVDLVAPVHLGDVYELLEETPRLVTVGFRPRHGPNRRMVGAITERDFDWWEYPAPDNHLSLVLSLDEQSNAVPFGPEDRGAPLFAFEPVSQRFVLVGISNRYTLLNATSPHLVGWTYLGRSGDVPGVTPHPAHDHSAVVRPLLGDDLDQDGMPDVADNCPPKAWAVSNGERTRGCDCGTLRVRGAERCGLEELLAG